MASAKTLRQLIKSGVEGNRDLFMKLTEQVIEEERIKQHHLLANDLERILYGRANIIVEKTMIKEKVPEDRERGIKLIDLREPSRRLEDLVLSDENASLIDGIIVEHRRSETIRKHGLFPVDRLLFCGPSGCGKTLTAEVIASELGLPFAIVRIDSVISSFLGETAANLRKVFDFISIAPMVVLFDEFDALAKERSDIAEHGEIKRVVNAVLQMMDGYNGKSLLIAATNHEYILDSAIWRRFDEVVVFELPNTEQIKRLLQVKLRGIRREFDIDDLRIAGLFKGMSHADVERVLRRAIKDMFLSGKEFLHERHLLQAIQREDARANRINRR